MRPPDLPSAEQLAQDKPHGTRIRYMAGCKCMLCRAANSRYETTRSVARKNGDWNGIVSADEARRHLRRLAGRGFGRRAIAAVCGVASSTLHDIKMGRQKQICARTAKAILSIDASFPIAAGHLVSAAPAWQKIRRMYAEGFSEADIARRLGRKSPKLQLYRHRITARNAMAIDRLYAQMLAHGDIFE